MSEPGRHRIPARTVQAPGGPNWAVVRDLINAYARSFDLSYDDRQDLVQTAAMRVWRGWATFRGQSRRSSWIYRVVRNEFLSWGRHAKRNRVLPVVGPGQSRLLVDSHEDEVLIGVVAQRWLSQLPAMDRRIVELRYRFELTSDEIGAATGLAGSSVRARLHRLRSRLPPSDSEAVVPCQ